MWKFRAVAGLLAGVVMLSAPVIAPAGVFLSINIAPPALQVYQQPLCPQDGYIWTPGYWGYGDAGYYWIPGAWLAPPQTGFLWTPGYWGYSNGLYVFNAGYWGPTVGFYGGVNYGFGYGGSGFDGGRWQGGHFAYNTAVSHVNTTMIHNTYNQAVPNRGNNRTSFNGGSGIATRPTSGEMATARQHGQSAGAPAARETPNAARPQERQAAAARTPQAEQRATQQQPRQVAAARTPAAASRPAPQQRQEAPRAAPERAAPQQRQETARAAPQRAAPQQRQEAPRAAPQRAAPQQRQEAPRAAAPARSEGKEERK